MKDLIGKIERKNTWFFLWFVVGFESADQPGLSADYAVILEMIENLLKKP